MTEYKILYGLTLESFMDEVNNHLKDGWELAGGIALSSEFYYQAVFWHGKEN